jgi:hypothetical protein
MLAIENYASEKTTHINTMSKGLFETWRIYSMIVQTETEAGMMVVAALGVWTGRGAAAASSAAATGADSPLTSVCWLHSREIWPVSPQR